MRELHKALSSFGLLDPMNQETLYLLQAPGNCLGQWRPYQCRWPVPLPLPGTSSSSQCAGASPIAASL